ncbi:hypothetical protein ACN47E_009225 [Coniothyrium glycines]
MNAIDLLAEFAASVVIHQSTSSTRMEPYFADAASTNATVKSQALHNSTSNTSTKLGELQGLTTSKPRNVAAATSTPDRMHSNGVVALIPTTEYGPYISPGSSFAPSHHSPENVLLQSQHSQGYSTDEEGTVYYMPPIPATYNYRQSEHSLEAVRWPVQQRAPDFPLVFMQDNGVPFQCICGDERCHEQYLPPPIYRAPRGPPAPFNQIYNSKQELYREKHPSNYHGYSNTPQQAENIYQPQYRY